MLTPRRCENPPRFSIGQGQRFKTRLVLRHGFVCHIGRMHDQAIFVKHLVGHAVGVFVQSGRIQQRLVVFWRGVLLHHQQGRRLRQVGV